MSRLKAPEVDRPLSEGFRRFRIGPFPKRRGGAAQHHSISSTKPLLTKTTKITNDALAAPLVCATVPAQQVAFATLG
jgi:hypothetical protein